MSTLLTRLGGLLGVRTDEVEAVLRHDARRAQSTVRLQRRGFLGAAAALAAAPFVPQVFVETFAPLGPMAMPELWITSVHGAPGFDLGWHVALRW